MPNILLVPLDNRPVCYQLPLQIAEVCNKINLFLPPKDFLGGLFDYASFDDIFDWAKNQVENNEIHYVILSLDTIAYGGLVASRRVEISFDQIKNRVEKFLNVFKNKKVKIFATSSIMRISNNNINEEEKEYWSQWGEKIFEYSYRRHLSGKDIQTAVPEEILEDYLQTRKRNFDMNLFYLELLDRNLFNHIVFSQDDTAKYGLNVEEGQELRFIIKKNNFNASVKTGADEIPLALLSRAVLDFYDEKISVEPVFMNDSGRKIISRYEDISIEECVKSQIELCGGKLSSDGDVELLVNLPNKIQDDIALDIYNDEKKDLDFELPTKPFAVADIKLANGADNNFVEKFLDKDFSNDLLGYAGWNTSANTVGSVLAVAMISFLAKKYGAFDDKKMRKILATRLLDDWAYQANIRQNLRQNSDYDFQKAFEKHLKIVEEYLECSFSAFGFSFPWDRTFEVEIYLGDN